jgi:phosphonate transport system ATP-binding protein
VDNERGAAGIVSLAPASVPAVLIDGLVKRYGPNLVLDGVGVEIAAGSSVAIIGANGSGKSTLLRALIRLVEPDGGRIDLLGQNVTGLKGRELKALRARVGMVFQKHNLVPRLSALSNVVHGVQSRERGFRTWSHMFARPDVRAEAVSCLEQVGLADKARQRADSMSGGQSQRVAVARMLMQRPEIILADEPDASLDPRSGEEVMRLLSELARSKGLTLIFVSHRIEHTLKFADRVLGLQNGHVVLDSPAAVCSVSGLNSFFSDPASSEPDTREAMP